MSIQKNSSTLSRLGISAWALSLAIAYVLGQQLSPHRGKQPLAAEPIIAAQTKEKLDETPAIHSIGDTHDPLVSVEPTDAGLRARVIGEFVQRLLNGDASPEAWDQAAAAIFLLSPEQAKDFLSELAAMPPSSNRNQLELALISRWAESDPTAALLYAGEMDYSEGRIKAVTSVLRRLAEHNPDAALKWLEGNKEEMFLTERLQVSSAVIKGFAPTDPVLAIQALDIRDLTMATNSTRRGTIGSIVDSMLTNGFNKAAFDEIASLPEGPIRNDFYAEYLMQLSRRDITTALTARETLKGTDQYERIPLDDLIGSFADVDPSAAAAFAMYGNPSGKPDLRLARAVAWSWAHRDLIEAANWANELPRSADYDPVRMTITVLSAYEDPKLGMKWADSLTDDHTRSDMKQQLAAYWKSRDSSTFEGWLVGADLPEAEKEGLRNAKEVSGGHFSR